jgi:hypothetical protein
MNATLQQFQSAIAPAYTYLQVLGNLPRSCKLLKVLIVWTLKRLASAVDRSCSPLASGP